jgi:hypothetical protein
MTLPESVRALIATGPPAYLTTLNADGSSPMSSYILFPPTPGHGVAAQHFHLSDPILISRLWEM